MTASTDFLDSPDQPVGHSPAALLRLAAWNAVNDRDALARMIDYAEAREFEAITDALMDAGESPSDLPRHNPDWPWIADSDDEDAQEAAHEYP